MKRGLVASPDEWKTNGSGAAIVTVGCEKRARSRSSPNGRLAIGNGKLWEGRRGYSFAQVSAHGARTLRLRSGQALGHPGYCVSRCVSCGGPGLITSITHFHEPSGCFFQIATALFSSVTVLPSGVVTDMRSVPLE